MCSTAWSALDSRAPSYSSGRCHRTRFAAQIGKATKGFAKHAESHHAGKREHRPKERSGQAGEEAQRSEVADEQVLRHVEREELLLADLRDRRGDGDDEQRDAEREERDAPAGNGLLATRERARADGVRDRDEHDRRELERLERPARQQRRLVHGADCTLGPWTRASRPTRLPASRSRRRTRWSSGFVLRSSPPARRASARSRGSIRWTATASWPRRPTRSGRSSSSRVSAARFARAAPTSPPTASTTSCTCGADPLFFLDYVAANRIELETVAELVEGAAEVCRAAGCALIGGETAELPGIYREDELDFAGTCVGIVEREALIDGSGIEAGDVGRRSSVGRRPRERVHARAQRARGRGLHG